jgi:hypothetical protein
MLAFFPKRKTVQLLHRNVVVVLERSLRTER